MPLESEFLILGSDALQKPTDQDHKGSGLLVYHFTICLILALRKMCVATGWQIMLRISHRLMYLKRSGAAHIHYLMIV